MDDRFMHELRRDPDPGCGRGLHEKLRNPEGFREVAELFNKGGERTKAAGLQFC